MITIFIILHDRCGTGIVLPPEIKIDDGGTVIGECRFDDRNFLVKAGLGVHTVSDLRPILLQRFECHGVVLV